MERGKEKGSLDGGKKNGQRRKIHEMENHLTGGTHAERGKLWAGKKYKEQFTGRMRGRRHGLHLGRGQDEEAQSGTSVDWGTGERQT